MSDSRTVRLIGGPLDGREIHGYRGGPVLMHSDTEAGKVARYRPTRDPLVLRFKGWDEVVASIPCPETKAPRAEQPAGAQATHGRKP